MPRHLITLEPGTLSLGSQGVHNATWIPSQAPSITFGHVEPASNRSPGVGNPPIVEPWWFGHALAAHPSHGTGPWRMRFTTDNGEPTEPLRSATITELQGFNLVHAMTGAALRRAAATISATSFERDVMALGAQIHAGDYLVFMEPQLGDPLQYVGRVSMAQGNLEEFWVTGPSGLPPIPAGGAHIFVRLGHDATDLNSSMLFLSQTEFAQRRYFSMVH